MKTVQKEISLPAFPRGFHLVTRLIETEMPEIDPTVREDFEAHFDRTVPERAPYYRHTAEGPDDMPAHIKASLLGSSVTVPITSGRLHLGTWQGIYLCEHRNRGGRRRLVVTAMGS
jgi:secondary thiamine-phosphate synthase enzyme